MKNMNHELANKIYLYTKAIELARNTNQVVGEKNDYYITLEQLERLLKETEQL